MPMSSVIADWSRSEPHPSVDPVAVGRCTGDAPDYRTGPLRWVAVMQDSQAGSSAIGRTTSPIAVSIRPPALALYVAVLSLPLVVAAIVVCVVAPWLPWWLGLPVGVAGAVLLTVRRLQSAHDVVVDRIVGDRPLADSERFENLVDALTLTAGIRRPEVFVLDAAGMNALAVSRSFRHTIIVTRGLIEALGVVELEGVVAALMVRLRNGDAESATLATALFGLPLIGGWYQPVLQSVADPVVGPLLPEARDLMADQQAVSMTRYPPGLLRALETIRRLDQPMADPPSGFNALWLIPDHVGGSGDTATSVDADPSAMASRSLLDLRIAMLSEL